jgi:hypothetical protein
MVGVACLFSIFEPNHAASKGWTSHAVSHRPPLGEIGSQHACQLPQLGQDAGCLPLVLVAWARSAEHKASFAPTKDYVTDFGHPSKNGKGHTVATWKGMSGVWVAGKKIWEVADTETDELDKRSVLDDGEDVFDAFQLDNKMAAGVANFQQHDASGDATDPMEMMLQKLWNTMPSSSGGAASSGDGSVTPGAALTASQLAPLQPKVEEPAVAQPAAVVFQGSQVVI